VLILYFSRTETTHAVAEEIAKQLRESGSSVDLERVESVKNYKGILGWFAAGYRATRKQPVDYKTLNINVAEYG
jgi:hypothetical protein